MAEAAPAAAFPRHTGVPEEDDDALESISPDFPLGFWRPGSPAEKNKKLRHDKDSEKVQEAVHGVLNISHPVCVESRFRDHLYYVIVAVAYVSHPKWKAPQ